VKHFANARFWRCYRALPAAIRALADRNYALLSSNPSHGSLHFKQVTRGSIEFVGAEPRKNPPCSQCQRAFFKVHIPKRDYDAFFNSPVGYRAQYCIGVENGETRNREILAALAPTCLALVQGKEPAGFPMALVAASLKGAGAKIWINEADLANLNGIHIEYQPWLAKAAAAACGTFSDQAVRSLAFAGVLAPVGTVLEVKGGWIAPDGIECRDPAKAHRAHEIHDYGFT
jgi:hypothetical protein